jgi:hypothetical protein
MPRPNYHQARKQKELARKARQQEKQQRRTVRPDAPGEGEPAESTVGTGQPTPASEVK